MINSHRKITRTALLLSLALLFQSLRFLLPVPPLFSTFIIGSLVNSCLLIAAEWIGFWPALLICFSEPIVAYFQQLIPLPILILPVAIGNITYIGLYLLLQNFNGWVAVGSAASGKALLLYFLFSWLLTFLALPAKTAAALMFAMSWPQLVTGILGGFLAIQISKRVEQSS